MPKYTLLIAFLVGFLLTGCGAEAAPAQALPPAPPDVTTVELVYLNHGPVRSVLADIDKLLAGYGEQVYVARYDVGTPEGEAFVQAKGLTGHTPLAISINGSMEFTMGDRAVKFYSFPQGQGTFIAADGDWTLDDLRQVLDRLVEQN
ncbi:MAG TPA: hypothetical protein VGD99_16120 [Anaerolineae bacterium]|jgi:hypothetical protein